MDNRFPQMLYRQPGTDEQVQGQHFGTMVVHDEDSLAAAKADGWHEQPWDARAAREAREAELQSQIAAAEAEAKAAAEAGAGPRRAQLEAEATALGVAFKPQTSDRKLAEAIAAAKAAASADTPTSGE